MLLALATISFERVLEEDVSAAFWINSFSFDYWLNWGKEISTKYSETVSCCSTSCCCFKSTNLLWNKIIRKMQRTWWINVVHGGQNGTISCQNGCILNNHWRRLHYRRLLLLLLLWRWLIVVEATTSTDTVRSSRYVWVLLTRRRRLHHRAENERWTLDRRKRANKNEK